MSTDLTHFVNGNPLGGPYPDGFGQVIFAMGCFWGAERIFWQIPGVWVTSVGYTAGNAEDPTYEQVCSGTTGHTEAVHVVYDPETVTLETLFKTFWEGHDPTQGMRQGNDRGSQYRSGIYTFSPYEYMHAGSTKGAYQASLAERGYGKITTEIKAVGKYFLAEDSHQQYLAKNPSGYCGIGGTGVICPIGKHS